MIADIEQNRKFSMKWTFLDKRGNKVKSGSDKPSYQSHNPQRNRSVFKSIATKKSQVPSGFSVGFYYTFKEDPITKSSNYST